MPTDPVYSASSATLAAELAELERRIRNLERKPVQVTFPAPFSSLVAIAVTSASFVNVYKVQVAVPPAEAMCVSFTVTTDSGTTGDVQLIDTVSGLSTSVLSLGASTNGTAEFEWLHPGTVGTADPMLIMVQARRTGGAGNVNVSPPMKQYFSSKAFCPTADVNGNPMLM